MKSAKDIYLDPVRQELSRLLSWQDREAFSLTYGSFDRVFWGWKFTDFPGARFQEGLFPLAFFYKNDFPHNPLFKHPKVLEWILAGMENWTKIQYPDGSFDEAYPFERSLAAVSFSGFYVGLAFRMVEKDLPDEIRKRLVTSIERSGNWLCRNDETHGILTNHLAAAAACLQITYSLTGKEIFAERRQHFLNRIYSHQSKKEGWYEEYGGADPGYQTHSTAYLAWIWRETKDPQLLQSLKSSLEFMQYFIHPNGTLGGEYASRNTEFYFPAGFEILAGVSETAHTIASRMRRAIEEHSVAGVTTMDSYNFLPLLNSYLLAAESASEAPASPTQSLPYAKNGSWQFPEAGIEIHSSSRYYALVGHSKAGALRVYCKETGALLFSDCGYILRLGKRSQWYTSQGLHTKSFVRVNQKVPSPGLFLCFRLFLFTFGRIPGLSKTLKNVLVKILVTNKKTLPVDFSRTVTFGENKITLQDTIETKQPLKGISLIKGRKFSSIHMGSSRYFQFQELDTKEGAWEGDPSWGDTLTKKGRLEIETALKVPPFHVPSFHPSKEDFESSKSF